jgi:hypothetical protein
LQAYEWLMSLGGVFFVAYWFIDNQCRRLAADQKSRTNQAVQSFRGGKGDCPSTSFLRLNFSDLIGQLLRFADEFPSLGSSGRYL